MFNRKYLLFTTEVKRRIDGFFDDRRRLKDIKDVIKSSIRLGYDSYSWPLDGITALYIKVHRRYFIKRGFKVTFEERYTTISW